jgi:hypothetical protein
MQYNCVYYCDTCRQDTFGVSEAGGGVDVEALEVLDVGEAVVCPQSLGQRHCEVGCVCLPAERCSVQEH